jgi:hypothetical protein
MSAELIETGDICLVRHMPKAQSWAHKAILGVTGARHDHDEVLVVRDGVTWALYARPPQCGFVSFDERREQRRRGEIVYAVVRLHCWEYEPVSVRRQWERWQCKIEAQCDLVAELRLPYDVGSVIRQGRNWLRDKIPLLTPLTGRPEHRMYCTESVEKITRVAGRSAFRILPQQDHYSPIHTERAWLGGDLRLIEDGGLAEFLFPERERSDSLLYAHG